MQKHWSVFRSATFAVCHPAQIPGGKSTNLVESKPGGYYLFRAMKTHQGIDERSLAMARAIVEKIDHDPDRLGLAKARATCERWFHQRPEPAIGEWLNLLNQPWETIRTILLDPSEEGQRLRQSDPFCGILTPEERWSIYKEFHEES